MSGDISDISGAVGEIGLGAAAATAVEPEAGGHRANGPATDESGHTKENACLNCGTALMGAHCHACGQKAKVHRTLRAFLNDLVHGVLHFEGKFWRTLPLLAWRPGRLMRDYINGKRASYVSPIALFLFTVFISFALFSISGGFGKIEPEIAPASIEQLEKSITEAEEAITEKNAEIASAAEQGQPVVQLEAKLRELTQERDLLKQVAETVSLEPSALEVGTADGESTPEVIAGSDTIVNEDNFVSWIGDTVKGAVSNPGLLVYKLQTNAYKLSWLLIPLSLPFLWILFPFSRKFKMYDHTVFITYSISFMTMLAVVLSIGIVFEFAPLILVPLFYAPFHLYRSLRGNYDLSRFGAMWRMVALSAGIWMVLGIFLMIMTTIVITG